MKVNQIAVTYGRKLNLGDFNSAHIEMTLWAELEDGDNEATAAEALWEMAKNNVKVQALPLKGKLEAEVTNIYMGLPVELRNQINGNGE